MIDSINFVINNVYHLDFDYLKSLGVKPKNFQVPKNDGFVISGYHFKYKDIDFTFRPAITKVEVKTTTHKLLKKDDITLSDMKLYQDRLNQIVAEVFGGQDVKLKLVRLDYYVDIELPEKEKKLYLNLYRFHNQNFGRMIRKKSYDTSVYRQTKKGQFNLNIYSRFECTRQGKDKNILRLELQMKKAKIQNELKKYGVTAEIDSYWSQNSMQEYYFDFLEPFFGKGPHRRMKDAKKIIEESDYSETYKEKLKKFLDDISAEIDDRELIKSKKYSAPTIRRYKQMLSNLSINTICVSRITDKIEILANLLDIAREIAETKYFK